MTPGHTVHGLPPAADGGGGRAHERGAGLGGVELAAVLDAGQEDDGYLLPALMSLTSFSHESPAG